MPTDISGRRRAFTGWCARAPSTRTTAGTQASLRSFHCLTSTTPSRWTSIPIDVRTDVFRASGAGGQHINKTSSAVRLTHLPTGIAVTCQNERSQHRNRELAWKVLRARMYEMEEEKRRKEREKLEGTKSDVSWGHQIRSYVLHPYQMVKDHRTDKETSDIEGFLNGNIQEFIEDYLRKCK